MNMHIWIQVLGVWGMLAVTLLLSAIFTGNWSVLRKACTVDVRGWIEAIRMKKRMKKIKKLWEDDA